MPTSPARLALAAALLATLTACAPSSQARPPRGAWAVAARGAVHGTGLRARPRAGAAPLRPARGDCIFERGFCGGSLFASGQVAGQWAGDVVERMGTVAATVGECAAVASGWLWNGHAVFCRMDAGIGDAAIPVVMARNRTAWGMGIWAAGLAGTGKIPGASGGGTASAGGTEFGEWCGADGLGARCCSCVFRMGAAALAAAEWLILRGESNDG